LIAIDGTRLAGNANCDETRKFEQIASEILAEVRLTDEREDEKLGAARGDELPQELRTAEGRREFLRKVKAKLADRDSDGAEQKLAGQDGEDGDQERAGRDGGDHRVGGPPKPYTPPEVPDGKVNISDPDTKRLKAREGYMQGYNAQAVVDEGQIVLAAEITNLNVDWSQLDPMVSAAIAELEAAAVQARPQVAVADTQYWNEEHMTRSWLTNMCRC
jgi:hypothetical protein